MNRSSDQAAPRLAFAELPDLAKQLQFANNIDLGTQPNSEGSSFVDQRTVGVDLREAQVITSLRQGSIPGQPAGIHYPLLDLDLSAQLIPSSSPDHFHLYIDHPLAWTKYRTLLSTLGEIGLLGDGFVSASLLRGYSSLRLPWVKKAEVLA